MSTLPGSNWEPTPEQVHALDSDQLLARLSTQCLTLRGNNLEKFRSANIVGSVFLECDYDSFRKEIGLDFGTAKALDVLVRRIKNKGLKRSGREAGLVDTASKKVHLGSAFEAGQVPAYPNKIHLGCNVYQTTGNNQGVLQPKLPGLLHSLPDFLSQPGRLFVDKTKYIEVLDEDFNYAYMFLRPRRFGKTTFLNLLCTYYDIAGADDWEDIFGGLYIGNNPTASRSKHMVLQLDLSRVDISGDISHIRLSLHHYLNTQLSRFLNKYHRFLRGKSMPEGNIHEEDSTISLDKVLMLVKDSGYTLFVGIDEYDAPANNTAFDGSGPENQSQRSNKVVTIETLFKGVFFSGLKQHYGSCISKYFLTGVLPAFRSGMSPLTATTMVSGSPKLHGICGLTDQQVELLAKNFLTLDNSNPALGQICWAMKKYYNGYYFAKPSDVELELHYNPQLVYDYLEATKTGGQVNKPEESRAIHTTNILASIADNGPFSMDDIVELMAVGYVSSEFHSEFAFYDLGGNLGTDKDTILSLLVYLGVLTRDVAGHFRIPNGIMKQNVLRRIEKYLRDQESLYPKARLANISLRSGAIEPFIQLLEEFMKHRALQSIFTTDEATLQGVVEMLLDPPRTCVGEFRLVVDSDGTKKKGDGQFGFVDIFVVDESGSAVILELKDIRLQGLVSGKAGRWHKPNYYAMEDIETKVADMEDQSLNQMDYMYWSANQQKPVQTTVGQMRKDAMAKLEKYMQVVKMGPPKSRSDSGVLDGRVKVSDTATPRTLHGFTLMAVGGRRVLWEAANTIQADFSYVCSLA